MSEMTSGDDNLNYSEEIWEPKVSNMEQTLVRLVSSETEKRGKNSKRGDLGGAQAEPAIQNPRDQHVIQGSTNGWMNRSKFKPHFNIGLAGNVKIATCIYCGKVYKEGESTGNLSKHITNNHLAEFKSLEKSFTKDRVLELLCHKGRSLAIPSKLCAELKSDLGAFASVCLFAESLAPFALVDCAAWKLISGISAETSLVETQSKASEQVNRYLKRFDDALSGILDLTDFVNLQVSSVSVNQKEASYLALAISFAPNLLSDDKDSRPEILLNNYMEAENLHLLDLIDVREVSSEGDLWQQVRQRLQKYGILNKIATVTANSACFEDGTAQLLVSKLNDIPETSGCTYLGQIHLLYSPSAPATRQSSLASAQELLNNAQFLNSIFKVMQFENAIGRDSQLQTSLSKFGLPTTLGENIHSRTATFLECHDRFLGWAKSLDLSSNAHARDVQDSLDLSAETLWLLKSFVNGQLQDGTTPVLEPKPSVVFLSDDAKSRDESHPLQQIAAALDPYASWESVNFELCTTQLLGTYFEACAAKEAHAGRHAAAPESGQAPAAKAARPENQLLSEWETYRHEALVAHAAQGSGLSYLGRRGSRVDSVTWWHERRFRLPRLFTLAVALLYTAVTCPSFSETVSLMSRNHPQWGAAPSATSASARRHCCNLLVLRSRLHHMGPQTVHVDRT
ncbi:putative transposase of the Rover5 hAT-like family [Lachancea mirantina]|uniref:Putative transposase of the Rover5 hAT-like family n=1 Tax=Lachancea mirantina TaxID=1230905 RepID=A0A1G4JYF4_9SACH|nr:putative transposase of the Rover5 hAT-like family [Lachancea mirantina]